MLARSTPSELLSRRARRSYLDEILTEPYLRSEYVEAGRSSTELAAELGCTHKTVLRYLDLYGLPPRRRGPRSAPFPELHSMSFLHARHVDGGASAAKIAAELGCSRSAVAAALREAGLSGVRSSTPVGRLTSSFLLKAYVTDRRSMLAIATEVGCGASTVARYLRRHGITVRSRGGRGTT